MRGGFIACFGGGADAWGVLEDAAARFRFHGGAPESHQAGSLKVAVLADEQHGPTVAIDGRNALLVHGATLAPLAQLQVGHERFAAVESDGERLRASRDPLGEAPLFFRRARGALWLATEIHPLAALAPTEPDLAALSAESAFVPYEMPTGRKGILRVPPGSTLEVGPDLSIAVEAYWRPDRLLATRRCEYLDAVEELRERFVTAVARRAIGRTGILLSGGLDSAAVAVAAPRSVPPRLVTVAFPDMPETDEIAYARATAEVVGAPLAVADGRTDPWNPFEEPEIFGAPTVLVPTTIFETAAQQFVADGVDTILDGHDGDGALGLSIDIYGLLLVHLQFRRLAQIARVAGWRSTLVPAVRQSLRPWLRHVPGMVGPAADEGLVNRLLPYFGGPTAGRMREEVRVRSPRAAWRRYQLLPLTPPLTLVFEQIETEAARFGVDVLHPFADPDLLRFLVSLPFEIKVEPGRTKALLRDALFDVLPETVRTRRGKVWFNAVLERRVDSATCVRWIEESGVRFPDLDYLALFRAAERDPDFPTVFGWIRLVRAHVAAAMF